MVLGRTRPSRCDYNPPGTVLASWLYVSVLVLSFLVFRLFCLLTLPPLSSLSIQFVHLVCPSSLSIEFVHLMLAAPCAPQGSNGLGSRFDFAGPAIYSVDCPVVYQTYVYMYILHTSSTTISLPSACCFDTQCTTVNPHIPTLNPQCPSLKQTWTTSCR